MKTQPNRPAQQGFVLVIALVIMVVDALSSSHDH
jgi:Tfp pilus assembly protein PilX